MADALILVDIQNDFLPGGSLEVPSGNEVVPVANELMERFDLVVATQDWHPANHQSFASQHPGQAIGDLIELGGVSQVLWPDHCVQGTQGAKFALGLNLPENVHVFQKGTDITIDSYSGFFDNGKKKTTGLGAFLRSQQVTNTFVLGLATDYCVKFTAMDALELGFKTHLILPGCRGVNLVAGDVDAAIVEMKKKGVNVCTELPIRD